MCGRCGKQRISTGVGTALKPAFEPIILARKPLVGTVAGNTLKHGVGGINIDACRIEGGERPARDATARTTASQFGAMGGSIAIGTMNEGRWPANVLHDGSDEVMAAFAAYGETGANGGSGEFKQHAWMGADSPQNIQRDKGSAARFFYCAKADADDRAWSKHPTVKPLDLIRWLSRLITPPGGHVLDLFAGSGTTGEAARLEGFDVTLIEREAEYVADINRRLGRASGADTPLFAELTQ